MMNLRTLAPGLVLLLAACASSAPPEAPDPTDPQTAREIITRELLASADAWNQGDLDGFLATYQEGPNTTFGGGSGFVRGLAEVRERYQRSYWADGTPADSLSFDIIEVRPLDDHAALVLGRYILTPPHGGTRSTGYFSLVYRLGPEGWRIVHDHSSASP